MNHLGNEHAVGSANLLRTRHHKTDQRHIRNLPLQDQRRNRNLPSQEQRHIRSLPSQEQRHIRSLPSLEQRRNRSQQQLHMNRLGNEHAVGSASLICNHKSHRHKQDPHRNRNLP